MDRFKKLMIIACLAVAAISVVNVDTAEAGDFGCAGGVCTTPALGLYHAPIVPRVVVPVVPVVHCQYKIFIYDCGIWRCVHTCNDLLIAQQKSLILKQYGYLTVVRKIIL